MSHAVADVLAACRADPGGLDPAAGLVAAMLGADAALVSVIDDRVRHLVGVCAPGEWGAGRSVSPPGPLCLRVVESAQSTFVEDVAALDLSETLLPGLRVAAYAGAPLRDGSGLVVGTVCVVCADVRRWSPDDRRTLDALAEAVGRVLEARVGRRVPEPPRASTWRAALIDGLQDGLFVVDVNSEVVEVNPAFEAMLGYGADGLPYAAPYPWWPDPCEEPQGYTYLQSGLAEAVAAGTGRALLALRHRDGRRVWADCAVETVPDGDGAGTLLVGVVRDVTADHLAAERAERLGALAAALVAAATVAEVRAVLAEHIQQAVFSDAFSVREIDAEAGVARAVHIGGTPLGYHERFTEVAVDTPSALTEVVTARRPVFSSSAEETRRRYGVAAGAHYEATRVEAMARFPLLVEGELIAVLSVGYWEPREFDAPERLFLTTMADLAAQALGRAVRSERLRADARRHRLLAAAQAAINRRLDPTEQLRALSRVVVPELADFSSVHVLHRPALPGVMPEIPVYTDRVASEIIPGVEGPPVQRGYAWSGGDPITETIRQGGLLTQPQFTPAIPDWATRAGIAQTFDGGLKHVVQAPVLVGGLVVAVASFGMCHDRAPWDADDLAIISEIAGHAATALEHGLTYQHTRETALVLQHSLLSDPPTVPGLELAGRYRPAGRDEVGGDWYDVLELGPGRLALAVGDVVGHDMTAAAAMGQLRAALRTLALEEDLDPGAVLGRLAEANRMLDITTYATVLFARLVRAGGEWNLTWASAGHLPPLLVTPDGTARPLDQAAGGVPLIPGFAGPYPVGRIRLDHPATAVLLYTDGLVERRGTDILTNITQLCGLAADLAGRPIDEVCDQLLATAADSDDTVLLAVRTGVDGPPGLS